MRISVFFVFALLATSSVVAANNSLTDTQLLNIKFDQRLGSQVSPDLAFCDETGSQVQLGDYFGRRPIILVLGYYRCPMLCSLLLDGMTDALRNLRVSAGKDYEVIFVSIDPTERPPLAAEKKTIYLRIYGRKGSENGWHFLTAATDPPETTGPPPQDKAIQTLANEIGFRFAYDSGLRQFAHPAGLVVLTPQGKVAHYLFGVTFSSDQMVAALHDAGAKKIGSPIQEFILLCCQYSPLRGKYGHLIMEMVRAGGVATVIALGVLVFRPARAKVESPK